MTGAARMVSLTQIVTVDKLPKRWSAVATLQLQPYLERLCISRQIVAVVIVVQCLKMKAVRALTLVAGMNTKFNYHLTEHPICYISSDKKVRKL